MSSRGHLQIFAAATAAWAIFWLIGWPSYYQQYSTKAMIWVCIVLLPPIVAICYVLLKRVRRDRRLARAAWLAFYFTVPLAIYDWLYCGVHLGYGLRFLTVFWYLTVFYIVPWIVLPATALALNAAGPKPAEPSRDVE